MLKRFSAAVFVAFSCVSLAATDHAAAQSNTNLSSDGNFYGRLSAGAIIPEHTDILNGTTNGLTISGASAAISSEVGQSYSGAVGYKLSDLISIEAEVSHSFFELDEISGSGTLTSGGSSLTVSGTASLDGDVKATTGMANIILTMPTGGSFRPYVGGGLGFVAWDIELNSATSGGTTLTCSGDCSDDGTDLTAKGVVGFDFAFSEGSSVGVRYQYLWTDTGTEITDDVTAHVVQASVKFSF